MAIDSGKPNRKLMSYYQDVMRKMDYDTKVLITGIIGMGDPEKGVLHPHKEKIALGEDYTEASIDLVKNIRSRLIGKFKELPDGELLVDGIFIVARKREDERRQ
jgi:hypothetical protein